MTESIGAKFVEVITPLVHINLSEAESSNYPYAVYDQTLTYRRNKDGVDNIGATSDIHIYGKDFAQVDGIAAGIAAAVKEEMQNDTYYAVLRTVDKTCTEGVWDIQMNYSVRQLK